MPPAEVTEAEIDQQVDMLLNYRATFEDVEGRAVEAEDYVTVDPQGCRERRQLAAEGRMLIAGSDSNPAEFNEARSAPTLTTSSPSPGPMRLRRRGGRRPTPSRSPSRALRSATPRAHRRARQVRLWLRQHRRHARRRQDRDRAGQGFRLPAEKENRCVSALAERLQLDEMDADYEQSVFEELGQNFLSNPLPAA